jgi:exodeoxyribonuclease VII small subunit
MSDQPDSKTFRENYKVLKEAADWLAKPGEADIDSLVPRVEAAMKAYQNCKDRLETVRAKLNQYFDKEPPQGFEDQPDGDEEADARF